MFKKEIVKIIKKEGIKEDIIEIPKDPVLGDYAVPCFTLVKKYKKSPVEIANELKRKLKPTKSIEKIESKGPYLNFFIKSNIFNKKIIESKEKRKKVNKTVIVEFSSPNTMKPFSVAHLRSTMIGNSIYKIYKFLGYKTIAINHLGDWGTQFGKAIESYKRWGTERELNKEPIKHLLELYVKFHKEAEKDSALEDKGREWFLKLEKGDKEAKFLWKKFRELSLREYKKIYSRLNVKFDSYAGEAFYEPFLNDIIKELKLKKTIIESEGALIANLEKHGLGRCIIQKSDGSTIYTTRDLAAAIYRFKKYKFDKNLYVVDLRQSLHFQQVFKILELFGYKWSENCTHISFGLMSFSEGIMSTRKGKVIFLEELLDKSAEKVMNIIKKKNPGLKNKKETAEIIGTGAVIFWDLSHDRIKDIKFDWENVLDFEGETAPYIQYTHARACSILRKSNNTSSPDYTKLTDEKEINLIRHLSLFLDVVNQAAKQYKPHILAKYVYELSQKFNEFYNKCPCIKIKDKQLSKARLNLVSKSRKTIKLGLELLGIKSPEQM